MTKARSGYLLRKEAREAVRALSRQVVFGLLLGWLLLLVPLFFWYAVPGAPDRGMLALATLGALLLLLTLFAPTLLAAPERFWTRVTQALGGIVFRVILVLLHLAVITPAGLLLRALRGSDPFCSWEEEPPAGTEGWVPKPAGDDPGDGNGGARLPLVLQPLRMLAYLVRQGRFFLIPACILLVLLGLLLFFVQTSALAPFLYTLF